ncbi:hypothetical protein J2S43_006333 [Catenuloplanes nepalensis]|uniref:Uncharacterized protein n=1 Tax=Catenuloplanes nepalensis TaxID=587533 RepID=A0ABT9N2Z2_9ACTN|nr:hypothetical protein [Catenuloplanes nepalensis]MDP9797821.1 hypothetical protein [Catenuloplanes nepalensis]
MRGDDRDGRLADVAVFHDEPQNPGIVWHPVTDVRLVVLIGPQKYKDQGQRWYAARGVAAYRIFDHESARTLTEFAHDADVLRAVGLRA